LSDDATAASIDPSLSWLSPFAVDSFSVLTVGGAGSRRST
jgi:hypothetical protein